MCIIVIKPIGASLPSKLVFETCFWNNPDGAGFMYNEQGSVVIQKGFMDFDSFWQQIEKFSRKFVVESLAMVFHFRIGTQGSNDYKNCHPFPLSTETDKLIAKRLRTNIGIVHNGIISLTSRYDKTIAFSDTHFFIKDYLSLIIDDNNFYMDDKKMKLIEKLADSKLTFLDGSGKITTIGQFESDDSGCLYSNNSYVSYAVSSSSYDFNYSINKIWAMPVEKQGMYAIPYAKSKEKTIWELNPHTDYLDRLGNIYRWSEFNPIYMVRYTGYYVPTANNKDFKFDYVKATSESVIEYMSDWNDDEIDLMLAEETMYENSYHHNTAEDYESIFKSDAPIEEEGSEIVYNKEYNVKFLTEKQMNNEKGAF